MEQNDPLSPSAEVLHALQHVGREASEKQQEREREKRELFSLTDIHLPWNAPALSLDMSAALGGWVAVGVFLYLIIILGWGSEAIA